MTSTTSTTRAQGGTEPPSEKTEDAPPTKTPDPSPSTGDQPTPAEDLPEQPDSTQGAADRAPGEPPPRDPSIPEAPPGDLIGPGPDNPESAAAD